MDIHPSHRAQSVKASPTLAVSAKAARLRADGRDILSLAAGEPDFETPEHVKTAAIDAINEGFTKYTSVDGTPELKEAVVGKFARENNLHFNPDQVLVSCGCKHSIYNLMQALLNPGDEVIIPAPYWVSYPDMARLAGAETVIIKTSIEHQFKITPEQLRGAIGDKSRLLVLNSPSNPTGACYSEAELEALGAILAEHPEIVIASDDIYEHILWSGQPFRNILNAFPSLHDRTVVLNGVSKAYAMTGWRIGYAAGPEAIISAMKEIQSQSTSGPNSIAQVAAAAALSGDQGLLENHCAAFRRRHDFVVDALNEIDGVAIVASDGTFYSFPDMSAAITARSDVDTDIELAELLLDRASVAVVPGSAFGAPGCLRLSYATVMETLDRALTQMQEVLGS